MTRKHKLKYLISKFIIKGSSKAHLKSKLKDSISFEPFSSKHLRLNRKPLKNKRSSAYFQDLFRNLIYDIS